MGIKLANIFDSLGENFQPVSKSMCAILDIDVTIITLMSHVSCVMCHVHDVSCHVSCSADETSSIVYVGMRKYNQ